MRIFQSILQNALFVCISFCPSLIFAQTWDEIIKLTASDPDEDLYFGIAVDIFGEWAVVGAQGDNEGGILEGAAYTFELSDGVWVQTQKLKASDAEAGDRFGRSVSIFGDRIAVGASTDSYDGVLGVGSVYIFELVDDVWTEMHKLTSPDPNPGAKFGEDISLDDNKILVGMRGDDYLGMNTGSAYVFQIVLGEWIASPKITPSDDEVGSHFGNSVSLEGDRIVIGAPYNGALNEGSAYVFNLIFGVWMETQKITASDPEMHDHFGFELCLENDRIAVGVSEKDDFGSASGAVYIFDFIDETLFVETQKITASDAASGASFGQGVGISGDNLIIGSGGTDEFGPSSGSAYLFESVDGIWTETQKITASDASEGDLFGVQVAIDGNTAIVSAYPNDDEFLNSGSAYIFSTCPTLPAVDIVIDETSLCEGDTLTLTGTGADSYIWADDVIDGEPFIPEIGEHTYSVIGIDDAGCENSASVDVTVHELPEVTGTADDPVLCAGEEVVLTGSGAVTYEWSEGAIDGEPFVPEVGATIFTVIGTDEFGCIDSSNIAVVVYEPIEIESIVTPEVFGDDGSIDITVTGGLPPYSFDWDNDGTGDFDDLEDLSGLSEGIYSVVILDEEGCSGNDIIEVNSSQANLESDITQAILVISPNPTSDFITIQFEGEFVYSLVSINGKLMTTGVGFDQTKLNLTQYSKGIYFIQFNSDTVNQTVKVVKN